MSILCSSKPTSWTLDTCSTMRTQELLRGIVLLSRRVSSISRVFACHARGRVLPVAHSAGPVPDGSSGPRAALSRRSALLRAAVCSPARRGQRWWDCAALISVLVSYTTLTILSRLVAYPGHSH